MRKETSSWGVFRSVAAGEVAAIPKMSLSQESPRKESSLRYLLSVTPLGDEKSIGDVINELRVRDGSLRSVCLNLEPASQ